MQSLPELTRREVLRTGALLTGIATAGCNETGDTTDAVPTDRSPAPSPTPTRPQRTVQQYSFAAEAAYWAWFPSDRSLWGRSETPYDVRTDGARWLAGPTADGGIRCRVEDDSPSGHSGFYLDLGPVGDVSSLAIEAESVRSDGPDPQRLVVALYADVNADGRYFDWTARENREQFVAFGADMAALREVPVGGTITIAADTELTRISNGGHPTVTLADLKRGVIDGIDPGTPVALQVSVQGSGEGHVEEAVVHDVSVDGMVTRPSREWSMFAHNARNTGRTSSVSGPQADVDTRWTFTTGGPVRSSPVVGRGTVYIGSDDGTLYAIDAATGAEVWTYETDGAIEAAPALLGRMVYVGSTDGRIYALTAGTGEPVWTVETGGPVRSSPTVEANSPGPDLDDLVVVGSDDGSIYFLDALTGTQYKTIETEGAVRAAPVIQVTRNGFWESGVGSADGKIYYWVPGYKGGMVSEVDIGAPVFAPVSVPYVSKQNVWYRATDAGVLSKQVRSTNPRWTFETDGKLRTAPVLAGDLVFVGSWDGHVYGVDVESGTERWAVETAGKIDSTPAIADGTLYVGSGDRSVYALDAASGNTQWTYDTGGEVLSSPAVADGTVYVGSKDGTVYALTTPPA